MKLCNNIHIVASLLGISQLCKMTLTREQRIKATFERVKLCFYRKMTIEGDFKLDMLPLFMFVN